MPQYIGNTILGPSISPVSAWGGSHGFFGNNPTTRVQSNTGTSSHSTTTDDASYKQLADIIKILKQQYEDAEAQMENALRQAETSLDPAYQIALEMAQNPGMGAEYWANVYQVQKEIVNRNIQTEQSRIMGQASDLGGGGMFEALTELAAERTSQNVGAYRGTKIAEAEDINQTRATAVSTLGNIAAAKANIYQSATDIFANAMSSIMGLMGTIAVSDLTEEQANLIRLAVGDTAAEAMGIRTRITLHPQQGNRFAPRGNTGNAPRRHTGNVEVMPRLV